MITSKHVREEIKTARKIIDSDAPVADKLKVLLKVIEVGIKVGVSTRVNVVKIMEKLEIEKVQPRRPNAEKKPEKTKE